MADEIVEEFLTESREGIERVERDLVLLEEDPRTPDVVDRIFRDVHTIKGVCGFLGFTRLERVTHAGESLLSKVRSGELEVCPDLVSALLTTVDAISAMVDNVAKTGSDGDEPHDALVARLEALTRGEKPVANDSVPPLGEVLVEHGVPKEAITQALAAQEAGDPRRIGEILIRREQARPRVVDEALAKQAAARGAAPAKDNTIRVSVDLLDELMSLVGELVLIRNQILQSEAERDEARENGHAQRLNLVTTALQEGVMKTRMQPIGTVWGKLPRVVRDLAQACGKHIRLEMDGQDTELDKTIIEAVKDPLTHLVRNACDHGIDTPDERRAARKQEEGVLRLRAYHQGGQVIIEVSDDGRGIDAEKVKTKALEKGLLTYAQAASMSQREALHLIFLPGFSTAAAVTNVSGRGVGMDVVKTNIERIGGTVDLVSALGEGTTIRITIPLTLAIIPALIVDSAEETFAIPQVSLLELVLLGADERGRVERVNETPVYRLRGKLLPLVFLRDQLRQGAAEAEGDLYIVVLQADGQPFGLVVEGVRDTEEIVVKPLGAELKGLGVYAGATIMGDGSVALILDVLGLAQRAGVVGRRGQRGLESHDDAASDRAMDRTASLLLFDVGLEAPTAVPLSRIDRLEEIAPHRIERAGGRDVVQYRGRIMPIVSLGDVLGARPVPVADDEAYQVVVIGRGDEAVGLRVHRLVDIVDTVLDVRTVGRRLGVVGTCVVQERVVELLDIDEVLAASLPELDREREEAR
ncbi:MAG: chemotaxis protein CheW [Sandaracinaceae bacterium]